jgi:hypothetical protein
MATANNRNPRSQENKGDERRPKNTRWKTTMVYNTKYYQKENQKGKQEAK